MTDRVEILSETKVFPLGADPLNGDDSYRDLRHFTVEVTFRGPRRENGQGGWAVMNGGESNQLSRAGNWGWPERFQQHQYRWDTREEALEMARRHVDAITVRGRTWAEWQTYFAERAAADPSDA